MRLAKYHPPPPRGKPLNGPYGDVPLDRVWRVFPNYKQDEICLYSKYTQPTSMAQLLYCNCQ